MPVEVSLNTPLAEALNAAIQPKLVEVGWGTGGADDSALAEYIILMLVNGKSQDEIAAELSGDLLGLGSDDPSTRNFSQWLFEQIDALNAQFNGGGNAAHGTGQDATTEGDVDTDMNAGDVSELNAYANPIILPRITKSLTSTRPTGPRSMRNGNQRGGRDKRMFGQMNKAMDRAGDSALHRVRGQTGSERINTHGRTPPNGPRTGRGGIGRHNNRTANLQAGLANMAAGGPQAQWMMQGGQPNSAEFAAILEQQSQMMLQMQQIMSGGGFQGPYGQQRRGGKSLFDRTQHPGRGNYRKGFNDRQSGNNAGFEGEGEDVDMSGEKREQLNPDETVCKYNLRCTNKDCKFAHQSPAAPPGTSVDVNDNCSFGAACKNRKCVARHPSPAARLAHQSELDCKFFPNCQNPQCPFKHPSMPLCRNGAGCTNADCKFTHVKTKCRFNPCLNPNCAFAHEEGQQGGFKDKVWTAGEGTEHPSERKFVDDQAPEELIKGEETEVKQETDVIG
ncbi:nuclear poly(A)-binding protein [Fusarium denticulatum]|uniref:Nuclear poly(A)-binding protein n=1 Tax=Fusarium denticulatum TaxID=48507 RepID=A0A8H6CU58_9HYPO|nr:nuclear poly(A)-binding protein [Fusarium denticulatum]